VAYLYRHIRDDKNEPFYIGIGSNDNYVRSKDMNGRNRIWLAITKKTKYRIEILINGLTWEEACEKECEFISLYGRINKKTGTLSNLTDGGEGVLGLFHREESKKRMSVSKSGIKYTQERNDQISKTLKEKYASGEKKPASFKHTEGHKDRMRIISTGKIHTEQAKNKMSEIGKTRRHSEETKLKISEVQKGKIISEETRAKMSAATKGNQRCLGYKHSDETKRKMSIASIGRKCPKNPEQRQKISNSLKQFNFNKRLKQNKMSTLQELSEKVSELQGSLDTEQQQVADLLAQKDAAIESLNTTIAELQALVTAGGTESERQAILDQLNAIKTDLEATVA